MTRKHTLAGLFARLLKPLTDALLAEWAIYTRPVRTRPDGPGGEFPTPTPVPVPPAPEPAVELVPWPAFTPGRSRFVVRDFPRPENTRRPSPASKPKPKTAARPKPQAKPKPRKPAKGRSATALPAVRCGDCGEPVVLVPDPDDPGIAEEVCPACAAADPHEIDCPDCGGRAVLVDDGEDLHAVCLTCPLGVELAPDPD